MSSKQSFNLTTASELIPNTFKGDKFSVVFSNLPSDKDFKDFRYFHNYIKTVTIPEYSMDTISSFFQGSMSRHPIAPKINKDLSQIMISFRLSEDMKNYFLLLDWMRQIRYGVLDNEEIELISKYVINSIELNLLDNHKRHIATISFLKCFCTMVSSLSLEFGVSDEVTFTVNFSYSEMTYRTMNIEG